MNWEVLFGMQVQKAQAKLPKSALKNLTLLVKEVEIMESVRSNWPNYTIRAPFPDTA